ncbi:MAG: NERD domain-containing protein [Oscillospiraceae bacterium]|nr:NERD domain-containing protein [Oscillospiraceae bacterium]
MNILSKTGIELLYAESLKKADYLVRQAVEDVEKRIQGQNFNISGKIGSTLRSSIMWNRIELGWRARKRLRELDYTSKASQEEAKRILTHEIYVEKRISTECSRDEGRGVSSMLDGLFGEKLTVFELELCSRAGFEGNILHNLEFEAGNRTIQIDVVYITRKGIFVFETKNYDGRIHGAEYQNKWTLKTTRRDYQFNNPVLQNKSHINAIQRAVQCPKYYSVVAFSDTCELDYMDIHSPGVFVLNLFVLRDFLEDMFTNDSDVLSEQEVEYITSALQQHCADNAQANPNYKEPRGYFSARTKAKEDPSGSTVKP